MHELTGNQTYRLNKKQYLRTQLRIGNSPILQIGLFFRRTVAVAALRPRHPRYLLAATCNLQLAPAVTGLQPRHLGIAHLLLLEEVSWLT